MESPYLSIVVVGRNDDYGKNFLPRFQIFLNNQFYLWEKHKLRAELIIVEWNPPHDKPRLKDVLRFPKILKNGSVRVIEVSQSMHERIIPRSPKQVFFEYIGKNIGARRAHGEFVLCTNTDLIYSDELIEAFAKENLAKNAIYRVDRYDMPTESIFEHMSPEEQLVLCEQRYRYAHNNYGSIFIRGESVFGVRSIMRVATYFKNRMRFFPYSSPYMNAAGDFFLMHKTHWEYLRGYPEIPPFAYPDALCFMALAHGLRQTIFSWPKVIYHQDHERGTIDTGRPLSDFESHKKEYRAMLHSRKPWIPNNEQWGYGNEKLLEYRIV